MVVDVMWSTWSSTFTLTFTVAVVDMDVLALLASLLMFVPAVVVRFELPWLGPMLAFTMGRAGRRSRS